MSADVSIADMPSPVSTFMLPRPLGPQHSVQLRTDVAAGRILRRSVKDEIREQPDRAPALARRRSFPGIIGYDDTVVPQIVNAILSRHNFILLGLRGQAKSRILRALVDLLDEAIAGRPGLRDPRRSAGAALRRRAARASREAGDGLPIAWLDRDARYVEKLATPDVTIADMIGDLDPIKAARAGLQLSDELTMHYGLLPRANRGIFAINELPDLAGKIQVGLFNILQEGDVQIKGYPVRLPLDVMLVFSANPEDYTARGKIITPLKDRIGSEIRTHYPATRQHAMAITAQEAWVERDGCPLDRAGVRPRGRRGGRVPGAAGSEDRQALRRQPAAADLAARERRLERRAPRAARRRAGDRAAHHRHLRGAAGDHRQVRARVRGRAARRRQRRARHHPRRGRQRLRRLLRRRRSASRSPSGSTSAARCRSTTRSRRPSCWHASRRCRACASSRRTPASRQAPQRRSWPSAVDFMLEGLYAQKKISRSEEFQYQGAEQPRRAPRGVTPEPMIERDIQLPARCRQQEEVLQLKPGHTDDTDRV